MKAVNIKWDLEDGMTMEDLPNEIIIPDGMEDDEEISDYISDVTGFCHMGFQIAD